MTLSSTVEISPQLYASVAGMAVGQVITTGWK